MKRDMRTMFMTILAVAATTAAEAQTTWTARQCMQYAVSHNAQVRRATLELDNYEATRLGAVGQFLPSVDAGVGVQYNFGRAIDPETNGYTDVSTFYNGYSVQASLAVFDGFSRLNALKAAKASALMGRSALREQQDQTALSTLRAWANVAYYEGTVRMAEERRREAELMLRQTQTMVDIGRKSEADLAQMEAQQAEADYELTRQQNLLASAVLELKQGMRYPLGDTLVLASETHGLDARNDTFTASECAISHPSLMQSFHAMQSRLYEWRQTRGSLFPSLSMSAGLSTTYYHTLHTPSGTSFSDQLKNNLGEYVAATLSVPLFSRLQRTTSVRRAKNYYRMAQDAYEEKRTELEKLSREAWQDLTAYRKQTAQMEKKVAADSLAYQLTRRQYEEGLSTAIDLHTSSAQLLQSKATLLQCRLMTMVKHELVRYYKGETIWTD